MLNVAPVRREYETLPGLNRLGIPAVAPLPTGETDDTRRLVERFGEAILAAGLHNGQQSIYVSPDKLVEVARFLHDDPALQYEALTDVSSMDRSKLPISPGDARFQTVYQLRSTTANNI